jgi:hypothetical protein
MATDSTKRRERYARARARGKARVQDPSSVVDARYDSSSDAIELAFKGGGSMTIPRTVVPWPLEHPIGREATERYERALARLRNGSTPSSTGNVSD